MTRTGSDHGKGVTELPYKDNRKQCSVDAVAEEIKSGEVIREWSNNVESSNWQAHGSMCMCSSRVVRKLRFLKIFSVFILMVWTNLSLMLLFGFNEDLAL